MEYKFQNRGRFLYARLPEFDDIDQIKTYLLALADALKEAGLTCILADARVYTQPLSIMEYLDLAELAGSLQEKLSLRIAGIVAKEATTPDRFFENAVRNRGVLYRWFYTEEEALNWLLLPE